MKITKTATPPFFAKVTLGLEAGYGGKLIVKYDIIAFIKDYQKKLSKEKGIYLSAAVADTHIVLSDQVEPHLTLSFNNYPKFPLPIETLKNEIEALTKQLMKEFQQNRVVFEYLDETIMFEQSAEIDPRII